MVLILTSMTSEIKMKMLCYLAGETESLNIKYRENSAFGLGEHNLEIPRVSNLG